VIRRIRISQTLDNSKWSQTGQLDWLEMKLAVLFSMTWDLDPQPLPPGFIEVLIS